VSTLTAPTTAPTIEGTTTAWPCESMWPDDTCANRADLIVATHTHLGFPVCWGCWDGDRGHAVCRVTLRREGRDEHARIVGWLS
jgi:hypothetical protein